MKAQTLLLKILFVLMTIAASIHAGPYVMAADVENCALCHKYSGLGRIDENEKKHLYYVNEELYQQSVHGKIRCRECHTDIEEYPHPNPKKVDCSTVCHLVDPSTDRKFSHANMIEKYELSVHGKGPPDNPKENIEDLPTCTYCHENRIHQPVSGLGRGEQGIAQEILDRCLGCHTEEQWTRYFYNHFTHRLHRRRSSRRMVELCASCHEDEEKMTRHDLKITGTFHDTFHWQGIKYEDPNAPNCITCHAPVGYFSHDIMDKSDPRSAIHKDNLVRTCSNPGGLQTCHPNATSAFAKGKIHPAGFKTGLLEYKIVGLERVKKIKKGEMKPFQLLRIKAEGEEMTRLEYYQQLILQFIKYFYLLLIGGLISFMIVHQALDYFATKREMSKRRTHL
jgi:cytochrome c553